MSQESRYQMLVLTSLVVMFMCARGQAQEVPVVEENWQSDPKLSYFYRIHPPIFRLDHAWEHDPELHVEWTLRGRPANLTLDPAVLRSGSKNESLLAARQIVRNIELRNISKSDEVEAALRHRLEEAEALDVTYRSALLSAAILLADSAEDLEYLWTLESENYKTRMLVEKALVSSTSKVAVSSWRNRMELRPRSLQEQLLAVRGLGQHGDGSDLAALKDCFNDPASAFPIRVAAAESMGRLATAGLEETAEQVIEKASAHAGQADLIAAYLLGRHTSSESAELLVRIARSSNRAAQVVAFQSLIKNHPDRAAENLELFLSHSDPAARRIALKYAVDFNESKSLGYLRIALGDINLKTRSQARMQLVGLAEKESLRQGVVEVAAQLLQAGDALAGEQACILIGEARLSSLSAGLIEMLDSATPEIHIAAAWALQRVELDGEALKVIETKMRELTERNFASKEWLPRSYALQLSYLTDTLVLNRVDRIRPLLDQFIPKESAAGAPRAAAIWGIGIFEAGSKNARLATKLAERLHDEDPDNPERTIVKYASAIAMGRILHPSSEEQLDIHLDKPPFPIGLATQWGLKQFASRAEKAQSKP